MAYDAQLILQRELDPGERLLWAGSPKQGIVFRASDLFMIPFSLLWGGFAIFWEVMVLQIPKSSGADSIIFPIFGIPFVLFGLYLIFGRFIYDSKLREKTFYGLTDQRAVIISGMFRKGVKSLNLKTMTDVSLTESAGGYGTIIFRQENQFTSMFAWGSFPGLGSTTPKFELIRDAKQVYNQLRMQQKS